MPSAKGPGGAEKKSLLSFTVNYGAANGQHLKKILNTYYHN